MLDIHSHILPQVDDGSASMQMTHDMLREAKSAGIDTIVASPHFSSRKIDRQKIQQVFAEVQTAAQTYGIQMRLGFEVHYSMLAHLKMPSIADWCIQGTHSLLLEFSNTTPPANWDVLVCDLIRNGVHPIIVHPERYLYMQKTPDMAMEMKRYGCELQIDTKPLHGLFSFGKADKKTAETLLRKGLADYIASDAHLPEHYRQFGRAHQRIGKRWPRSGILHELLRV